MYSRAVTSGAKGGDDYRGPRLRGAHGDLNRLAEASLKRRSGQLPGHCCASSRKLISCTRVFLSLANLNIQKSLKHSNTSNTEPSSPSGPPAPERTNTNRSLNMQTEKGVKEPNSAPARGVLCAQGARRDASQSA